MALHLMMYPSITRPNGSGGCAVISMAGHDLRPDERGRSDDASAFLGTGLHGRIGNTDIKITGMAGNDYVLSVSGTMRETVVFGESDPDAHRIDPAR